MCASALCERKRACVCAPVSVFVGLIIVNLSKPEVIMALNKQKMRIYYLLKKANKHNTTKQQTQFFGDWLMTSEYLWLAPLTVTVWEGEIASRRILRKLLPMNEWTLAQKFWNPHNWGAHKPSTSAWLFQKMHCGWRVIVSDGCCTGFFFPPLFTNVDYCPRNQNGHFFLYLPFSHLARAPFISWWSLFLLAICFNTVAFPRVHLVM